jgi:hypothetical protein
MLAEAESQILNHPTGWKRPPGVMSSTTPYIIVHWALLREADSFPWANTPASVVLTIALTIKLRFVI